jgi:glycosyltransferase involved in cell wall biosynthesis
MDNKLPISVCILVKNEEIHLEKCLSLLNQFSEVIILDTGSEDKSIEICKKHDAQVNTSDWKGFTQSRIELFNKANSEWIFWLDADEYVSQKLVDSLFDFFKAPPKNISALKINRKVYFEKQWVHHGHWFPDWNIRLFKKDAWEMHEKLVHESISLKYGDTFKIEDLLEHHSFKDWNDFHQRQNRYINLWAEGKFNANKKYRTPAGLHAIWDFIQGYFLKKGILDGQLGFKIARQHAHYVSKKHQLLKALNQKRS